MKKGFIFITIVVFAFLNIQGEWKNFVHFSSFDRELFYKNILYISSESGLGQYDINSDSLSVLTTANGISSNKIIDMCNDMTNLYLLHDSTISIVGVDSTNSISFPIETGNQPNHIAVINNKIYISTNNGIISGDFNGIFYQFSSNESPFGKFRSIISFADTAIIASDSGVIFAEPGTIWDSTTWYKHYKNELNSPHINSIVYKDKKLYFATNSGMNTYSNGFINSIPSTGLSDSNITFCTVINNTIYAIMDNHIYYLENNNWKAYSPISNYSVSNLSGNNNIIIASNTTSIYKIDTTKTDSTGNPVVEDITPITLLNNSVAAIACNKRGELFILYGPNSNKMDILNGDSISHYQFQANTVTTGAYSVAFDRFDRAWIGFWYQSDSGIVCIDSNRNEHWYSFPSNTYTVSDIRFDNANRLWLLNYSDYSNLFMLNSDSIWTKFNNSYTGWMYRIYIDRHNNIWLGSYHIGEASCLDTSGIWHKFDVSATVSGFAEIDDTTMYIATENGICIVTNLTNVTKISQLDNINLDNIVDINMDPYNNLWIAKANDGIYIHHSGKWKHFSTNDGLVSTNFVNDVGGNIKKPEKVFAFDKKNNFMYIASFGGISRFYDDSLFTLPDNNIILHIYPNPVNHGKVLLDLIPSNVSVLVYSINGKYMGQFSPTDIKSQLSFDTAVIPPGIYYAVAKRENRKLAITKFAVTNK